VQYSDTRRTLRLVIAQLASNRFLPKRVSANFDETGCEMWRRPFLIIFLSAANTLPAFALDRPFPASTKRGEMTPALHPAIVIEGKTRQLSPGARIWNEDNLIQMPASLRGTNFVVNYTENEQGEIDRVWILTPDEARRPLAQQTNSFSR
jgi:hypothetical protein